MNKTLAAFASKAGFDIGIHEGMVLGNFADMHRLEKFSKFLIEDTLKEVDDCCYGRGENSWCYEKDKKWIRNQFGIEND